MTILFAAVESGPTTYQVIGMLGVLWFLGLFCGNGGVATNISGGRGKR